MSFPEQGQGRQGRQGRKLVRLLLVAVLPVVVAGLLWLGLLIYRGAWDFRNNLWGPSYLLVHGENPYDMEILYENVAAVWFPQVIGLFFPLGWLKLAWAASLWFLLNLVVVLALVWWYRDEQAPSIFRVAIVLVAVLSFPPVLWHIVLGQFSLLPALLFLLAGRLFRGRRSLSYRDFLLVGLLLALVLSKPQLAVLVVPGLWVASLRREGLRGALLLPLAVCLGVALLSLPVWLLYPRWVPTFVQGLQEAQFWYQPTLYTNGYLWWGPAGRVLPITLSLGCFLLNLWLWWRYPPEEVLPWSLALTTFASPYLWTWDFVLFLPLMLRSMYRQRSAMARAVWGGGYLLCWGLLVSIRLATDLRHHRFFWMPWLFLALVLGGHAVESWRLGDGRRPLLLDSAG